MRESARRENAAAFVQRNALWNFWIIMLMMATYFGAISFIYGSTVLTVYASQLTDSATLVGLVPAIQAVGIFLPQLVMVRKIQNMPRKHPFIVRMSIPERVPYLFIGLSILLWPEAPKPLAYAILVFGLAVATGSGGLLNPAIQSVFATVVQPGRRGLLFGLGRAAGGLIGVLAAVVVRRILTCHEFPIAYGICFLLSFALQVLCWIAITLLREPEEPIAPLPKETAGLERRLPELLGANRNFCRYLVARVVLGLGTMGTAFYILYGRQRFGMGDASTANLTMTALLGQTLTTPVLGWLGDRWGHKHLLEIASLMIAVALAIILIAPSAHWLYATFALMTAGTAAFGVAGMAIMMEFFEPAQLPSYSASAATAMGLAMFVAPVIGGRIVDLAGYRWVFAVALGATLCGGAIMRWMVRSPARPRASE